MTKLAEQREFPSMVTPLEKTRVLGDKPLCDALQEIDREILRLLLGKALTNRDLHIMLQYCTAVQGLNLRGFKGITADALPQIAKLSSLTSLNLSATKVNVLTPLIENPLPNLTAVHFFQTEISHDSLIPFLAGHKISVLTLPINPPRGFFQRISLTHLKEVSLHLDDASNETIGIREIINVAMEAPALVKLQIFFERAHTQQELVDLFIFSIVKKKQLVVKSSATNVNVEQITSI